MAEWTTPTSIHSKCGEDAPLHAAIKAIDNNITKYWTHPSTCYHWIIFDLEQTYTITKIRLYQSSTSYRRWGLSAGLDVFVSGNPADWGSAVWTGVLNATGWQESGAFSKNGRYVKLVAKDDSQNPWLYEFDAYCAAVGGSSIPVIMHHYQNMRDT
jgi:hypothetical protein